MEKEIPLSELLKASMKVDNNIKAREAEAERNAFFNRMGLQAAAQPIPALAVPAPAASTEALAASLASGGQSPSPVGEGSQIEGGEPLAALYPDDDEPNTDEVKENGTDENGQLQGQGGGNDESVGPIAEQGQSIEVSDQGQGGETLTDGGAAPAAPVVAPPVIASPWGDTPVTPPVVAAPKANRSKKS